MWYSILLYTYLSEDSFVDTEVQTQRLRIILKNIRETIPQLNILHVGVVKQIIQL